MNTPVIAMFSWFNVVMVYISKIVFHTKFFAKCYLPDDLYHSDCLVSDRGVTSLRNIANMFLSDVFLYRENIFQIA